VQSIKIIYWVFGSHKAGLVTYKTIIQLETKIQSEDTTAA